MRFRLRIYSPRGVFDFILPVNDRFVVGSNPQSKGHFLATESYVLAEHLVFTVGEQTCQAQIESEPAASHETYYNDQPLSTGRIITLQDGDRLVIRQPLALGSEPTTDDPLIALVFEVLDDDLAAEFLPAPPLPIYTRQEIVGGLQPHSVRLLHYLPEIYRAEPNPTETFLSRYLALIESFLLPAEWTINNFDLLLDRKTVPEFFLPWLEQWVALDERWDNAQSRALLAHYPWRGTRRGLQSLLQVYTGELPQITEGLEAAPLAFYVRLPVHEADLVHKGITRAKIERLIQATKPIHTTYQLTFAG